jgi:hypothetical protein
MTKSLLQNFSNSNNNSKYSRISLLHRLIKFFFITTSSRLDGIFYFVENESFSPRLLQETTEGIDFLRNHFNPSTPLHLILFRHKVSDLEPFTSPSPSPVHFHELAKQKNDPFFAFFDVRNPSTSEDSLLQMARTLCVIPDLCFVEAPALAPPEVGVDEKLMRQYEVELEQAKVIPLPEADDFEDWSPSSASASASASASSSSSLFGAPSVNIGGSAFQLNGHSFGEEGEEAGFGLWSHPSLPLRSGFNSGGLRFSLQETKVEAQVLDAVSRVTIQQVFENKQNYVVENVTFSFPMDAMAAVCGFEAIIGNKRVR